MTARRRLVLTLGLFTALAVVHTWPLVLAPGTWCRNDNADAVLNEWALAWLAHALATNPLRLFDANIFYPEPRALAFSEHLIPQGLLGAPLFWMGASVVLVYNFVWFAGVVLSGTLTCHVLTRWTGCWTGGLVAGSAVAFSSHVLTTVAQVQGVHLEFLPIVLLMLDEVLTRARVADGLRLGAASALQMLCSGYLLVFTCMALVASLLARATEWATRRRFVVVLPALAAAGCVTLALVVPVLLPYLHVRTEQGLVRTLEETREYSAIPTDYLSTAARFHYAWWSHRFYRPSESLFPGVLPLAFAVVAIGSGRALRDRRARMLLVIGITGVVLSLGPSTAVYRWLHAVFPLLQGIRAAARFGLLAVFATAGLAAFGVAAAQGALNRRGPVPSRLRAALSVALVLLVNVELTRTPLSFVRFEGIPPAYDALAAESGAIVAEFPFPPAADFHRNAASMLGSTRHWQRLLNGYSGFVPKSYEAHARALEGFPDDRSIALLTSLGVTHVIVQTARAPDLADALGRDGRHFLLMTAGEGIRIYRFRAGPP